MALVNKPDESIFASSAKQGEVDNFPDLLRGWGITFDQTQGIPPMEWFNFLFKRLDEKHTYLMQRGLPEWSATQDYTKGSCVQFDGVSYRALKNSKNNSPNESNSQYWVRWGFALSEIAQATLTQYGITKLYTGYDSQSEDLALTPKTAYQLKQFIDSNTRSLGNFIPNSKKSSAVNSNSEDTVANSKAAKIAYDKGVEAKTAADNAQRTANDGVSKADAAQRTANDGVSKANAANNNANGRVSKSGDTLTGMLKITSSSTTYLVNGYDWPKKIELSGDSVIGNEASVIGFNNNGTLHLGGKPNSSEFNVSIDETRLWVKGDVVTKEGSSLDSAFMKTGGVVTGKTSFKQGDWSGVDFYNNSGRYARIESNPHSSNNVLSFIYRESNGSNINVASLPRKNGNILLDADFTYQKISNFEVRKYPDGTMIQTYFVDFYDVHGPNSGIGGTGQKQLTWAVSFSGKPLVWGNITSSLEDSHDVGVNILTKSTATTLYWYNYEHSNQNQGSCRLQFLAIGRWK